MTRHPIAHIDRALTIKRTLGVKVAARYLYLRGWSLESALFVLLGITTRG
jgi:hypothetical protein